MSKFLKKYKYTSLMVGALVVAIIGGGVGGFLVCRFEGFCDVDRPGISIIGADLDLGW